MQVREGKLPAWARMVVLAGILPANVLNAQTAKPPVDPVVANLQADPHLAGSAAVSCFAGQLPQNSHSQDIEDATVMIFTETADGKPYSYGTGTIVRNSGVRGGSNRIVTAGSVVTDPLSQDKIKIHIIDSAGNAIGLGRLVFRDERPHLHDQAVIEIDTFAPNAQAPYLARRGLDIDAVQDAAVLHGTPAQLPGIGKGGYGASALNDGRIAGIVVATKLHLYEDFKSTNIEASDDYTFTFERDWATQIDSASQITVAPLSDDTLAHLGDAGKHVRRRDRNAEASQPSVDLQINGFQNLSCIRMPPVSFKRVDPKNLADFDLDESNIGTNSSGFTTWIDPKAAMAHVETLFVRMHQNRPADRHINLTRFEHSRDKSLVDNSLDSLSSDLGESATDITDPIIKQDVSNAQSALARLSDRDNDIPDHRRLYPIGSNKDASVVKQTKDDADLKTISAQTTFAKMNHADRAVTDHFDKEWAGPVAAAMPSKRDPDFATQLETDDDKFLNAFQQMTANSLRRRIAEYTRPWYVILGHEVGDAVSYVLPIPPLTHGRHQRHEQKLASAYNTTKAADASGKAMLDYMSSPEVVGLLNLFVEKERREAKAAIAAGDTSSQKKAIAEAPDLQPKDMPNVLIDLLDRKKNPKATDETAALKNLVNVEVNSFLTLLISNLVALAAQDDGKTDPDSLAERAAIRKVLGSLSSYADHVDAIARNDDRILREAGIPSWKEIVDNPRLARQMTPDDRQALIDMFQGIRDDEARPAPKLQLRPRP